MAMAVVGLMLAIITLPAVPAASAQDNQNYITTTVTLDAGQYKYFSANVSSGEQIAFNIGSSQQFDLFIFNQQQFNDYVAIGIHTSGYNGPAQWTSLGTFGAATSFGAQTSGKYYLVLDNTIAGVNPGNTSKTIDVGVIFPYTPASSNDLPFISALVIIAVLVIIIIAIWFLRGGSRKDDD